MKNKIIIFSMFVIVLQAFAIDMDEIINKTIEKYENLNSFYAEFNQILCDEVSGTCSNFEGKIYFLRPNFFRMEMENPKQIYVGDSVSLWVYLPEKNRAIRQSLGQIPFQINPDIFLKDYEKRFNAELTDEDKNSVQITLTPKDKTDIYEKIIIKILKDKFEIAAITIIDEIGSESKFNFDKIEINKKISKKLFDFNPPKGTQIDEY
ncbi:outer membrane lipoprotein carrier protein LolA [candidate division WOR-3 bacterium]|nr:outer membrane lipoprotein carrier protein LolA [candidate division WOR-3 bacterium]